MIYKRRKGKLTKTYRACLKAVREFKPEERKRDWFEGVIEGHTRAVVEEWERSGRRCRVLHIPATNPRNEGIE